MTRWIVRNRVFLWAILLLMMLMILVVLNENQGTLTMSGTGVTHTPPAKVWSFVRETATAIALACLLALLSETPVFKNFVEARFSALISRSNRRLLQRFDDQARVRTIERVLDPQFLAALSPEHLDSIEANIVDARFPLQSQRKLRNAHRNLAIERAKHDHWRESYKWTLTYEGVRDNDAAYLIRVKKEFSVHNATAETRKIECNFSTLYDRIPGITEDQLHVTHRLEVDGISILDHATPHQEPRGHRLYTRRDFTLDLAHEPINVLEEASTYYPHQIPYVAIVLYATSGFEMAVNHPTNIKPILYCVGRTAPRLSSPLMKPDNESPKFHNWRFEGWLEPSAGIMVLFTRA